MANRVEFKEMVKKVMKIVASWNYIYICNIRDEELVMIIPKNDFFEVVEFFADFGYEGMEMVYPPIQNSDLYESIKMTIDVEER